MIYSTWLNMLQALQCSFIPTLGLCRTTRVRSNVCELVASTNRACDIPNAFIKSQAFTIAAFCLSPGMLLLSNYAQLIPGNRLPRQVSCGLRLLEGLLVERICPSVIPLHEGQSP